MFKNDSPNTRLDYNSIDARYQDIADNSIWQVCQDLKPEISSFILGYIEPKILLSTLKINS